MADFDTDTREDGKCGYISDELDTPCGHAEGWGYENSTNGFCKPHGERGGQEGNQNAVGNDGGAAPEGNQNPQTHALFASHDGYYHDLDNDAQAWVSDFTDTLLDRYRDAHGKEPDMFDREALKNIAIDFHRVGTANSWFSKQGLAHTEEVRSESFTKQEVKVNVWASEIRQYNESVYRRMQKHGLLDDPESQKADAIADVKAAWINDLTE